MAEIKKLDTEYIEEDFKIIEMKAFWQDLNKITENKEFNNSYINNYLDKLNHTDIIDDDELEDRIYITKEIITNKILHLMDANPEYDKDFSICINSKKLQNFIDTLTVSCEKDGEIITKSYSEYYKLPKVTDNNRDAITAHLFYNFTAGEYADNFLDGKMTLKSEKIAEDMQTTYYEPLVKGLTNAKAKIKKAESMEKPKINGFKSFFGRFFRKIGIKSGWAKEVTEYEADLDKWNKANDIPKEKEIVEKYNKLINDLQEKSPTIERSPSIDESDIIGKNPIEFEELKTKNNYKEKTRSKSLGHINIEHHIDKSFQK